MRRFLLGLSLCAVAAPALAGESAFHAGPVIPEYGRIASVDSDLEIPEGAVFKVQYDVSAAAAAGGINRTFETAARFLNMHVENGVAPENIHLAIVIHGKATNDVTNTDFYKERMNAENANAPLIAALIEHGVEFYVCGQSAAYYDVAKDDLLPGVQMALSAMTAHALLDAQGYMLNPY